MTSPRPHHRHHPPEDRKNSDGDQGPNPCQPTCKLRTGILVAAAYGVAFHSGYGIYGIVLCAKGGEPRIWGFYIGLSFIGLIFAVVLAVGVLKKSSKVIWVAIGGHGIVLLIYLVGRVTLLAIAIAMDKLKLLFIVVEIAYILAGGAMMIYIIYVTFIYVNQMSTGQETPPPKDPQAGGSGPIQFPHPLGQGDPQPVAH